LSPRPPKPGHTQPKRCCSTPVGSEIVIGIGRGRGGGRGGGQEAGEGEEEEEEQGEDEGEESDLKDEMHFDLPADFFPEEEG